MVALDSWAHRARGKIQLTLCSDLQSQLYAASFAQQGGKRKKLPTSWFLRNEDYAEFPTELNWHSDCFEWLGTAHLGIKEGLMTLAQTQAMPAGAGQSALSSLKSNFAKPGFSGQFGALFDQALSQNTGALASSGQSTPPTAGSSSKTTIEYAFFSQEIVATSSPSSPSSPGQNAGAGETGKGLFATIDASGNGLISQNEFENKFGKPGDPSSAGLLFDALDRNADKSIDGTELVSGAPTGSAPTAPTEPTEPAPNAPTDPAPTDGAGPNGTAGQYNWSDHLFTLLPGMDSASVPGDASKALFARLDANEDGVLGAQEFGAAYGGAPADTNFAEVDANKDGSLDWTELSAAQSAVNLPAPSDTPVDAGENTTNTTTTTTTTTTFFAALIQMQSEQSWGAGPPSTSTPGITVGEGVGTSGVGPTTGTPASESAAAVGNPASTDPVSPTLTQLAAQQSASSDPQLKLQNELLDALAPKDPDKKETA
jgi:hypothetical protein